MELKCDLIVFDSFCISDVLLHSVIFLHKSLFLQKLFCFSAYLLLLLYRSSNVVIVFRLLCLFYRFLCIVFEFFRSCFLHVRDILAH